MGSTLAFISIIISVIQLIHIICSPASSYISLYSLWPATSIVFAIFAMIGFEHADAKEGSKSNTENETWYADRRKSLLAFAIMFSAIGILMQAMPTQNYHYHVSYSIELKDTQDVALGYGEGTTDIKTRQPINTGNYATTMTEITNLILENSKADCPNMSEKTSRVVVRSYQLIECDSIPLLGQPLN